MGENKVYGAVSFDGEKVENIGTAYESKFRVAGSENLPAKVTFFTKLKNVLFYEIKFELTPHEQKIGKEFNSILHKEITWQSFKNFWLQEIEITHKGKRIL